MPADRKADAVNIAQVPTPQLRFVSRQIAQIPQTARDVSVREVRILQQRWSTIEVLNGLPTDIQSYEWRDVPLEVE